MSADLEFQRALGPAMTAVLVTLVTGFLVRSAQSDTLRAAGSRSISYPRGPRIFVILAWIFTLGLSVWGAIDASKHGGWKTVVILVGLFVALILPLHIEMFGVLITWDDTNIYTRSPWRRRRTIPISAVKSCDYFAPCQWYRIHTEGHGIVRLHLYASGIPDLLKALPCPVPPYPPIFPSV